MGLNIFQKKYERFKMAICGGIGHISTFVFSHKLITGEGGMILTSNAEFAKKSRELRNLCFMPERRFHMKTLAIISDLQTFKQQLEYHKLKE